DVRFGIFFGWQCDEPRAPCCVVCIGVVFFHVTDPLLQIFPLWCKLFPRLFRISVDNRDVLHISWVSVILSDTHPSPDRGQLQRAYHPVPPQISSAWVVRTLSNSGPQYGLDYTLCPVVLLRPPRVMRSATEQWSPSASRHIGSRPLLVRIDQQRLVGLPGRKPPGYSRLMPRSSA